MGTRGYLAYRLRGRYYPAFYAFDSYPTYLGKLIIESIPTDPDDFRAWKSQKIALYLQEETRIIEVIRDDPLPPPQDEFDLTERPSRDCPELDTWIEWVYVIDLDRNMFRVSGANDVDEWENWGTQYFRLDNIPRWLFELEPADAAMNVYPVMLASLMDLPNEYWATAGDVPEADLLFVYSYHRSSPRVVDSIAPTRKDSTTWRRLKQQLLAQFVKYYVLSLKDVWPSIDGSEFVFRQLAYAILCILQGGISMRFNSTSMVHKILLASMPRATRTPNWQPPDSDCYWLGDVIVVLDEYIEHQPNLRAAIGKAIQVAHTSSATSAVIFSLSCVVTVKICHTSQGVIVWHTNPLPFFNWDLASNPCGKNDTLRPVIQTHASPTIVALLDLFESSSQSPLPVLSRPLPAEICELIFRSADVKTQNALEGSCRLFRRVAQSLPRIGQWTLFKCSGDSDYTAIPSSGKDWQISGERVVNVVGMGKEYSEPSGCEVVLWRDGDKVELGLPLLVVKEVKIDRIF